MGDCPACKNGTLRSGTVETWMPQGDQWVLFKNVPASVCDVCGESVFDQAVAERLNALLADDRRILSTGFRYFAECDLSLLERRQARGEHPLSVIGTEGLGTVQNPVGTGGAPVKETRIEPSVYVSQ